MKKLTVFIMILSLFCFSACADPKQNGGGNNYDEIVNITLGTFPIGSWGDLSIVSGIIAAFQRDNPNIHVTIQSFDYNDGDAKIENAIDKGTLPDVIFEGPERLVANWGVRGLMADISDLMTEEALKEIDPSVVGACRDTEGKYYIYPICRTTHCMAINYDMFKTANALQYIDEQTHTWKSTAAFFDAIKAIKDYKDSEGNGLVDTVATVYCGGQGGDQGTRALVTNLYGGSFTDSKHTEYTMNCPENIRALEELRSTEGIGFDSSIVGNDEINMFCAGELAMAFCWNVSIELTKIKEHMLKFEVFPMAFPSDEEPRLQGGIWGFGIFDNKDAKRLEAAKTFIRYMTENEAAYKSAVVTANYWPVKNNIEFYENDTFMNEYGTFQKYFGDYYQITTGWADARTYWWQMLKDIGEGEDVAEALKKMQDKANGIN